MLIQDEAPRTAYPLATLAEDYERAVLHLAWDRHTGTNERTLLFAWVEMLPVEVPPPLDDGEQRTCLGERSNHVISLQRSVVPARRALAWYLACRRGVAVLPDDTGQLPEPQEVGTAGVVLADLGEEPPWPTLVCVSGESDTIPFCPRWHEHPRVHHLVPLAAFPPERLWPEEAERTAAARWLLERMHFSLDDYPEYWGSVHLVAPNPVYRDAHRRLLPGIPPRESVLVRFQPRAGKTVEGLELTFTEKEPWGPLDVRHAVVKSPLLRLAFERAIEGTRMDVFDPKRGMLAASASESYFAKSFRLNMSLTTTTLSVRGSAPGASYDVSRTAKPEISAVGGTGATAASARSRIYEAHYARTKRRKAREQGQRWFSGQQEEAAEALRELIQASQREMLIVDPHFGPDELFTFALAVSREDVPVRILSSASALTSSRGGANLTQGDALLSELDRIASQARMNPIEVRVMTGEPPAVHDRFLLVDGRIWLLGSSLREFGARGTMIVELPDPDSVRERLFQAWSEATELRTRVGDRASGRDRNPPERP